MRIPTGQNWMQLNNTEYGDIWSSFNLSLSNKGKDGKLLVSPRMLVNTSSADDADLGLPTDFRYLGSQGWFSICGVNIFKSSNTDGSPFDSFTQDSASGTPTNCNANSSMEVYPKNDDLYVTVNAGTNNVKKWDGSAWTQFTAGVGGFMRKLAYHRPTNRMYTTYGVDKVVSWDENDSPATIGNQYTVSLGESFANYLTTLVSTPEYLWLLTLNTTTSESRQYYWDGSQSTGPNGYVTLDANGAIAGWSQFNTLFIVTTDGRIMARNGSAFIEKQRFPFAGKTPKNSLLVTQSSSTRWIHPNGVSLVDGKVLLLINPEFEDASLSERAFAGIWEYDPLTDNLYHKYSISYHAKTSGSITDYGQGRLSAVGAVIGAKHSSTDNGSILCGATYFTDATTTANAIFIDDTQDTLEKCGIVTTGFKRAENIKDSYVEAVARIRPLLNSTDQLVMKARTKIETPVIITGTWTSTATFTTTTDLRDYVGWEVQVLNGTGSGQTAHITSVAQGTLWTITVDDTFTGVTTGTFKARVSNFTKLGVFNTQSLDLAEFPMEHIDPATQIQLRLHIKSKGENEIQDIILDNKKHQ